jgi:hypothetical protein
MTDTKREILRAFLREIGKAGGAAGRGEKKRRPQEHYVRMAKLAAEARARKQKGKEGKP